MLRLHSLSMTKNYLSKTSIGISGKKRLATAAKIFTLTEPGHDSGDSWKDKTMKAKKAKKSREEESREEEEEVRSSEVHPLRSVSPMRLACAVGVVLLLSSSAAAHAASITNRDERDHKVTIIEGDTKTDHVHEALASADWRLRQGVHRSPRRQTRTTSTSSRPTTSCPSRKTASTTTIRIRRPRRRRQRPRKRGKKASMESCWFC